MLDAPLLVGPLRVGILLVGIVALVGLAARSGRRWWRRQVPLSVAVGTVSAGAVALVVDRIWRPFPDPVPGVALLWTGLGGAAVTLAVLRLRLPRKHHWLLARVLPFVAAVLVVVTGAAQLNQHYWSYPTLRSALGLSFPGQVDFGSVLGPTQPVVKARPGAALMSSWSPPPGLPKAGVVTQVPIPGTVSGFAARPAWIYLPPAYLSVPRAQLPVLVLVPGQPGSPRDWLTGGQLQATMDAFAAAHAGLAPVVVVADPLGGPLAQTLCVDSSHGRAFTYLTVDVPAWIRGTLQVDPDARHWAVGGASAGGTCALQLAVNAPSVYPTFLDLSGQVEPTVGSRSRTVTSFFGGNEAAFRQVNPLDVLASGRVPPGELVGTVVAGTGDSRYRPEARQVYDALRKARLETVYLELPGGHSWQVWRAGLREALPRIAVGTGLISG